LQKQIFGVDIDDQAVEVTKFSLLLKLLEDVSLDEIDSIAKKKGKILPQLENNILCGNSLVDGKYLSYRGVPALRPAELMLVKPFDWESAFPLIFTSGGFDVIIGNPPYTKIQNMVHYSPQEVGYYQSKHAPYLSPHGKNFDKYHLFFERAVSLIAENGCVGFIIPHKFMTTKAGEVLRQMIAKNKILKELIHFGANQVFEGQKTTTYTCIIIVQKKESSHFSFEKVLKLPEWKNSIKRDTAIDISSDALSSGPWLFPTKQEQRIIARIETVCKNKLKDIAQIFVGIQTSADTIFFIIPEKEDSKFVYFKDCNNVASKIEKEILKGAILDQTVAPFLAVSPNKRLIFPYEEKSGKVTLISESVLKTKYPNAYKYLLRHKEKLLTRNMQDAHEKWYQFGRSQSLNKFNSEKLVIKNPALYACAAFDDENIFFSGGGNGPYYGLRSKGNINTLFLLALLNHPIFDRWVKLRSSIFRGGYYSFGKQFIEGFPIKIDWEQKAIDTVVDYWTKIVQLNKTMAATPHRQTEILRQKKLLKHQADKVLSSLYGINHDELSEENNEENGDE
jgi:hypothetical protein